MRSQSEAAAAAIHHALDELPLGRWLLAVSGGRDSMVLLDAMATARRDEIAAVATFDHGTGAAARRAAALVGRTAERLEIPVVSGTAAAAAAPTEASWRAARWHFLNAWAEEFGARVVTAHTRDDQIETVVLRLLRGSGPRGLAGMLEGGASAPRRPLIAVSRATIADYATARAVSFIEDPSNASRAHQRNRVRLDLLPALSRAELGFADWCWTLGARAAAWRADVESFVDRDIAPELTREGALIIRAAPLSTLGAPDWSVLWPALGARVGVALDRRGIERASAWAPTSRAGSQIPLAAGATIARTTATFVIRRAPGTPAGTTEGSEDYIFHR